MATPQLNSNLKDEVRDFWNSEPCGTRYLDDSENFESHSQARYKLEPHIPGFAQFRSARGLKVLEIGTGMGADYLEWLKAGAHASGIDLSAASIERANQRCKFAGYQAGPQSCRRGESTFSSRNFRRRLLIWSLAPQPRYESMHSRGHSCSQAEWRSANHAVSPSLAHRNNAVASLWNVCAEVFAQNRV